MPNRNQKPPAPLVEGEEYEWDEFRQAYVGEAENGTEVVWFPDSQQWQAMRTVQGEGKSAEPDNRTAYAKPQPSTVPVPGGPSSTDKPAWWDEAIDGSYPDWWDKKRYGGFPFYEDEKGKPAGANWKEAIQRADSIDARSEQPLAQPEYVTDAQGNTWVRTSQGGRWEPVDSAQGQLYERYEDAEAAKPEGYEPLQRKNGMWGFKKASPLSLDERIDQLLLAGDEESISKAWALDDIRDQMNQPRGLTPAQAASLVMGLAVAPDEARSWIDALTADWQEKRGITPVPPATPTVPPVTAPVTSPVIPPVIPPLTPAQTAGLTAGPFNDADPSLDIQPWETYEDWLKRTGKKDPFAVIPPVPPGVSKVGPGPTIPPVIPPTVPPFNDADPSLDIQPWETYEDWLKRTGKTDPFAATTPPIPENKFGTPPQVPLGDIQRSLESKGAVFANTPGALTNIPFGTSDEEPYVPLPSRNEADYAKQQAALADMQRALESRGAVFGDTPGALSNIPFGTPDEDVPAPPLTPAQTAGLTAGPFNDADPSLDIQPWETYEDWLKRTGKKDPFAPVTTHGVTTNAPQTTVTSARLNPGVQLTDDERLMNERYPELVNAGSMDTRLYEKLLAQAKGTYVPEPAPVTPLPVVPLPVAPVLRSGEGPGEWLDDEEGQPVWVPTTPKSFAPTQPVQPFRPAPTSVSNQPPAGTHGVTTNAPTTTVPSGSTVLSDDDALMNKYYPQFVQMGSMDTRLRDKLLQQARGRESEAVPSFQTGGVVPGPFGKPRLINAEGGEVVLPTDPVALMKLLRELGLLGSSTSNPFQGAQSTSAGSPFQAQQTVLWKRGDMAPFERNLFGLQQPLSEQDALQQAWQRQWNKRQQATFESRPVQRTAYR